MKKRTRDFRFHCPPTVTAYAKWEKHYADDIYQIMIIEEQAVTNKHISFSLLPMK